MVKYKLIPLKDSQTWVLELEEGKYQGVQWQFGRVDFQPQEDGRCKVMFDYNIVKWPNNDLTEDQDFINILAEILNELMTEVEEEKGHIPLKISPPFNDDPNVIVKEIYDNPSTEK